jgi:hypothetical protein
MTTKLEGELKRELRIGKQDYTVKLSPEGFTLALKGNRKGLEIRWADLVGGDAALAAALNASLTANIHPKVRTPKPESVRRSAKRTSKRKQ